MLVEPDGSANHRWLASETVLPIAIAEYHHWRRVGQVVDFGIKKAAVRGRSAQFAEIISRDQPSVDSLVYVTSQRHAGAGLGQHCRKHAVVVSVKHRHWVGDVGGRDRG